jgi:hypothetical protein
MKKETNNRSIFHLFPRRSSGIKNENRRYSCEIINRTSDKIFSQTPISNDITTNDPSQSPILAKFCSKNIWTTCIPESIRFDQDKNQQINIDLLYAYDPFQIEVGDTNLRSLRYKLK